MRRIVRDILSRDPEFQIIGEASNGEDAVNKILQLKPDLVILDLEMPKKNGIEVIREVMPKVPTRILVFSSHTTEGAEITTTALTSGAVDFIFKPAWTEITKSLDDFAESFIEKAKVVARSKVPTVGHTMFQSVSDRASTKSAPSFSGVSHRGIVAIASSTGGPKALSSVIPRLPSNFPVPVVIVQHMPPGFTKSLAMRLDRMSKLTVKEGEDGEEVRKGFVYIAPGGKHMVVQGGKIVLLDGPKVKGVKPSADVLFDSVGREYKSKSLGVVLTGIGDDGADGAKVIKRFGGKIIAESEDTAIIFGMPKAVIKLGLADRVEPINRIPDAIVEEVGKWR